MAVEQPSPAQSYVEAPSGRTQRTKAGAVPRFWADSGPCMSWAEVSAGTATIRRLGAAGRCHSQKGPRATAAPCWQSRLGQRARRGAPSGVHGPGAPSFGGGGRGAGGRQTGKNLSTRHPARIGGTCVEMPAARRHSPLLQRHRRLERRPEFAEWAREHPPPDYCERIGRQTPLADVLVEHAPESSAYSPYLGDDGDIGPRAAFVGNGTPSRPFILCSGASPVRLVLERRTTSALASAAAACTRQPMATCRSRSGLY